MSTCNLHQCMDTNTAMDGDHWTKSDFNEACWNKTASNHAQIRYQMKIAHMLWKDKIKSLDSSIYLLQKRKKKKALNWPIISFRALAKAFLLITALANIKVNYSFINFTAFLCTNIFHPLTQPHCMPCGCCNDTACTSTIILQNGPQRNWMYLRKKQNPVNKNRPWWLGNLHNICLCSNKNTSVPYRFLDLFVFYLTHNRYEMARPKKIVLKI